MRLIATCKLGLESLVAAELKRIGIEPEAVADARVTFRGDFSAMARACLWLRTAERVLLEVGDILDLYIYRAMAGNANLGYGAAAGLYQSLLCFATILLANFIVKKVQPDYTLF